MAVSSSKPPANAFVRVARKVYNPVGFSKGYNFVLWFIFVGALMGFTLSRLPYLDFYGVFCKDGKSQSLHAGPGECFYYLNNLRDRVGLILHLATILPAGFLVCFQFVPVIRHKAIMFHRVNGYAVILLSLVGTAGALMIARHAFGGDLATQTVMGLMSIMFVGSIALAYVNIKLLQIEQHRAWMLRGWFYVSKFLAASLSFPLHHTKPYLPIVTHAQASAIITLRFIQAIASVIISGMSEDNSHYGARPCAQIFDTFGRSRVDTLEGYPDCKPFLDGVSPHQYAVVKADMSGGDAITAGVALGIGFGAAGWLALAIHAIGIEIYVSLLLLFFFFFLSPPPFTPLFTCLVWFLTSIPRPG